MLRPIFRRLPGLVALLPLAPGAVSAFPGEARQLVLELEGGPIWQTVNDVQIPNDATGSRFSLVDVIGKGPWSAGRVYATWNLSERNGLRVLLAPLSVTESATLSAPVNFAGGSFGAGSPVEANYQFHSWRLSYRYRFHAGDNWQWWIGFTAKVRDARIRLVQDTVTAEKTDVGFVPLLHLAATYRLSCRWTAELDADALAGGPGRAEDAALKLRYRPADRWSLAAGYRTVEGGADVDEVYNFAWLHYAVASVGLEF
ncbi:MAG: hypothetical protein DHS20C21_11260 [Gemmatimonadota bacterium]|nr:MAG: hypothetical protein DHS20C21_11260 [Gemmatimonadota bacterium]